MIHLSDDRSHSNIDTFLKEAQNSSFRSVEVYWHSPFDSCQEMILEIDLTASTKTVFLDSHSSVHPIIHSFVIIRHGLTYQKLSYRIEIQYHLSRQANIRTLCENCSKMSHLNFWHFPPIFVLLSFDLSVNTV